MNPIFPALSIGASILLLFTISVIGSMVPQQVSYASEPSDASVPILENETDAQVRERLRRVLQQVCPNDTCAPQIDSGVQRDME